VVINLFSFFIERVVFSASAISGLTMVNQFVINTKSIIMYL